MEMLARSGAFDQLDSNRKKVFDSLDAMVGYSAATHEEMNSSQGGLFGDAGEGLPAPRLPMPDDWLAIERLTEEHKAIGFYLSGHPLDDYMGALKRKNVLTLKELEQKAQGSKVLAKIAGSVAGKQIRKSARGNRFAFAQLTDPTGAYEVTIFSDTLEKYGDYLEVGKNVVLTVEANVESDQLKLLARSVQPADVSVQDAAAMGLKIFVSDEAAITSISTRLNDNSQSSPQRGPVHLVLSHPELPGEVEIALKGEYPMNPQIKGAIKHIAGVLDVEEF
jgi:DNA polymerase-3 subunit alpha